MKFIFKRYISSSNLSPVYSQGIKIYEDPLNQRDLIREENNGKIGIYCWINKETGKFYIGSGDPLYLRISDYYQAWYYISHSNLYIVRALFKYGMENFSLVILEYCESYNLIMCEQKWIDQLKPEYNTNPTAGNTKGYKHTIEAIEKMRKAALGRKHTEKVKELMSKFRTGKNNPFYGKKHSDKSLSLMKDSALKRIKSPVPGIEVEITNIETKITTVYDSIRKAALAIGSDIKTILRREKSQIEKGINTPYKKKYMITIKR
jgi:group I intron endonuclease